MKKTTNNSKRRSLAHLLSEDAKHVVGGVANGVHVTCSGEEWRSWQTEYTEDEWRNW